MGLVQPVQYRVLRTVVRVSLGWKERSLQRVGAALRFLAYTVQPHLGAWQRAYVFN